MAAALAHRGPDGRGMWLDEPHTTGLASTRLAIIDIERGKQPMTSSDGRWVLVFNGEIYNHEELRQQLEDRGHSFRTRCDTEVLLHSLLEWGTSCLPNLRGMFGFAFYDTEERRLLIARDRTGIKPLYYHQGSDGFFFASELKAILLNRQVPRRLDYAALADYMVLGYPVPPRTMFADCAELPPGSWLELDARGEMRIERFWGWTRSGAPQQKFSPEELRAVLLEAVREHLQADVPLGAFLSGGIDSSLLAALIVRGLRQPLKTFNVKFAEKRYDESPYARAVAAHLGTEHHEITIADGDFDRALVERVLDQFDQPFADSSAIPTYLLSRAIREHVKVVIGGDGGDEMFGGYPRFRYAELARRVGRAPAWVLAAAKASLPAVAYAAPGRARQARRFLRAANNRDGGRLVALSAYTYPEEFGAIFLPEVLPAVTAADVGFNRDAWDDPGGDEFIDATIWTVLPGDYLRKIDVASSAHGLEVRVPFLANQVLDYAARMPSTAKYSWNHSKVALRALAAQWLPSSVAAKPKWGFGIPLDTYLGAAGRGQLRELLASGSARIRRLLRMDYVDTLAERFMERDWDPAQMSRLALYQRVYSLWSLERWLHQWGVAI
jgi:asparagine synthase (glutamine-hydrolysing)